MTSTAVMNVMDEGKECEGRRTKKNVLARTRDSEMLEENKKRLVGERR